MVFSFPQSMHLAVGGGCRRACGIAKASAYARRLRRDKKE